MSKDEAQVRAVKDSELRLGEHGAGIRLREQVRPNIRPWCHCSELLTTASVQPHIPQEGRLPLVLVARLWFDQAIRAVDAEERTVEW